MYVIKNLNYVFFYQKKIIINIINRLLLKNTKLIRLQKTGNIKFQTISS